MSTAPVTANTSLVTFLLDRSSSMQACKAATIEAFNGYVGGLQAETEAAIDFTFLQFDTQSLDKVCVAIPVRDVPALTPLTYQPRGGTPLIDAAVKTIRAVEQSLSKRQGNPKIVMCFQTDGEENSSVEYTWEELHGLIAEKQALGWQFNFLGAGIDAYVQGARMGIAAMSTMSYNARDLGQTRAAFAASASNAADYSAGRVEHTFYSDLQKAVAGDAYWPTQAGQPQQQPMAHGQGLDLTVQTTPAGQPKSVRRTIVGEINLSDG